MERHREHIFWTQINLSCTKSITPRNEHYFAFYRVTEQEILRIEVSTRYQGRLEDEDSTKNLSEDEMKKLRQNMAESTKRWHEERKLRITASNFGSVMSLRDSTPCVNRVAALVHYDENYTSKEMDYGKKNEAAAIKLFTSKTGKPVEPIGLVIDRNLNYLAASAGK